MERPSVFIGSSSEGIELARAVRRALLEVAKVNVWNEGIFSLGSFSLESLIEKVQSFDFAVLVLTPDDNLESRSNTYSSPRDNVVFEMGLFMGVLGRHRTFVLRPSDNSLRRPSDLDGLVTATYEPGSNSSTREAVAAACDDIRDVIRERGVKSQDELAGDVLGWGTLFGDLADGALSIKDRSLYVQSPSAARAELTRHIAKGEVIPSRYHYSSDVLAKGWIDRCREQAYEYHQNTRRFWEGSDGKQFAERALHAVGSNSVDFVSLGPGDGEKDAELVRSWLDAGADLLYYPYDISFPLVSYAVELVRKRIVGATGRNPLRVKAVLADFNDLKTVRNVFEHRNQPNIVALLVTLCSRHDDIDLEFCA